jgi:TonB family protein
LKAFFASFVVALALPFVAHAAGVARDFPIPQRGGVLHMEVEEGWEEAPPKVARSYWLGFQGTGPGRVRTLIDARTRYYSEDAMRRRVQGEADRLAPSSVEKTLVLEKLEGHLNRGFYFKHTDTEPKPDEWRFLYQGVVSMGERGSIAFRILFNEGGEGEARRVLAAVVEARHTPPPPVTRNVTAGSPLEVLLYVKDDCSAQPHPTVRTLASTRGAIVTAEAEQTVQFEPTHHLSKCNGKVLRGLEVRYVIDGGAGGRDSVSIEYGYNDGSFRTIDYRLTVYDTPPRRAGGPTPEYPRYARRTGIEGEVLVWVTVDAEGKVKGVQIRRSPHDVLSEAAAAAAWQWKFTPPTVEGKPVEFVGEYSIIFRLDSPLPEML